jgi:autotransporter-associated beta strand protein
MQWRQSQKGLSAAVAAAALAVTLCPQPRTARAAVDEIWIGRGNSASWTNPANWDQVVVPNGFEDVARFTAASGGPLVDLSDASIQLSQLDFSDPLFAGIIGNGTINLVNNALIHANGNNFDLPEKVYTSFGTTDPANPRPGNNLSISLVGTVGLNKTGDSHLQIDAPQFYTGTTTISGGKIISTVGDSAFGAAANPIFLNNGSIQISNSVWNTNRTIYVGGGSVNEASNGSIFWVNGSGTLSGVDFHGDVAGIGSMQLNGFFTSSVGTLSAGSAVFHASNSFSGTLNLTGGTVALRDDGALLGIGSVIIGNDPPIFHPIYNGGSLVLDNSNSGANLDRINDYTPMHMRGSALTVVGGNTRYEEGIGSLVLDGGVSFITVNAGAGGASLGFSGLDRGDIHAGGIFYGAGLVFRGNNLGATPGPDTANIYIGSGTLLLQHGLLPFAYVNANYTPGTSPESVDNLLATYDATVGVKPVLTYDPDFVNNNPLNNVKITSNFAIGSGTVNANSLVLTAPSNLVSAAGQGMTLSGAGTIQLASGVILSANAGYTGTLGTVNSLPGNIISSNLNFGTQMASILTPSALSITGAIYGSGGLTKLGGRTLVLYSGNKYTGPTYLTGFTRFVGNVWADGFTPNPFGLDLSPITIYGGNASPVNPINGSYMGTGYGQLGSDSPGTTNFNRQLELRGDRVLLRSFGDGTLLWNGTISLLDPQTSLTFLSSKATAHQVVNGPIFGPVLFGVKLADGSTDFRAGQVVIGSSDAADPNSPTWVDLRNEGVFNGGLVLAGGTLGIGHDRALGGQTLNSGAWMPGTVQISGNTLISAIDGPRIIDNHFVNYGNTFGIGGSNTITLTGTIDGRGGDYIANITSTVNTIISGTMTGGGIVKTGSGTLVLKGNNLFTGVLAVGNGTTSGGALVLQSSNATGATLGATGVDYGTFTSSGTIVAGQQNQLILDSTGSPLSLNIPTELLYLRGFGIGNTGALRNLTGNNTWGGTIRVTPTYRNAGTATASLVSQTAGIGVDANTTLTVGSGILADDDPGVSNGTGTIFLATSQGLRKVGGGTLVVGSLPLSSGSNIWNSAINLTGSLEIQGGTVVARSGAGVGSIAGGRSVIDVASISLGSTASPTGRIDLTDNAMVVNYSSTSPILNIRNYLKAGYTAAGVWGGTGITSSTATPLIYAEGKITLGYADTQDFPMSNLFGDPLDSTSIVIRSLYAGDSNFDGKVDVKDLTILALHWQQFSTFWTTGDFNYDGVCNINDLTLLAMNWQKGVANPLPSSALTSLMAAFGMPQVSVPEPASALSLLSAIGLTTLARRRRRPGASPRRP